MASTSRSVFLLGLLVASFCVTAYAGRALTETNKLSLVDQLLYDLLHDLEGPITLALTCDLTEVVESVLMTVEDVVGGAVVVDAKVGVVTALKPIKVEITTPGKINIKLVALDQTVPLSLELLDLDPVLEAVGNIVGVVLKLVETLLGDVKVLQIVDSAGKILATITADA